MDTGGELALLPLNHEEAGNLLASVPEEERTDCWWLVLHDGVPVRGDHGGAVLLLMALRFTRPVGRILNLLHLSAVFDALDQVLSRLRGHLGRFVPDGQAPRRFP